MNSNQDKNNDDGIADDEEGTRMIQTRIKSHEQYNESPSFSNNLIKCQSFRASRDRGGGGGGVEIKIKIDIIGRNNIANQFEFVSHLSRIPIA